MGSHGQEEASFPSPSSSSSTAKRPVCIKCNKPIKLRLCSRFTSPPLHNSISITVLKHNHEVNHPLNSTRVAKLGFKNISVVTVSDVNLHAQLDIQPLLNDVLPGSGSDLTQFGGSGSGSGCTGSGQGKNWCKYVNGEVESSSFEGESLELAPVRLAASGKEKERLVIDRCREIPKPMNSSLTAQMKLSSDSSAAVTDSCNETDTDNCIVKEMNKYKVICSPASLNLTVERTAKPNLNWVPKTLIGKSLIDNGFRVKKLHTKKKSNSTEIYDIVEYDMIVPPKS